MPILNDLFIECQRTIIADKFSMIRFLNKDMAFMLQLKEKTKDPELVFHINCMIQSFQAHVRHLGGSIVDNRRWIHEREESLRLRDHKLDRNDGRNRSEGRDGREAAKE